MVYTHIDIVVFCIAVFTLINDWSTLHFTELHRTSQTSENGLPFWDEIAREPRIARFLPRSTHKCSLWFVLIISKQLY